MTFWRSETLQERLAVEQLIIPFEKEQVARSAYELCMGREAFITSSAEKKKIMLSGTESLVIPAGQFALLLSEETVKVPLDAIAFISIRFKFKRRGLINVSGFHVDPGFEGRLKFSVYNAGSNAISISQGDRLFLIWFASLDGTTGDGYGKSKSEQNTISSDDQNVMHGEIASPAELKKEIENLKHLDTQRKWMLGVLVGAMITGVIRLFFMSYFTVPSSNDIDRLRKDILQEIREQESPKSRS